MLRGTGSTPMSVSCSLPIYFPFFFLCCPSFLSFLLMYFLFFYGLYFLFYYSFLAYCFLEIEFCITGQASIVCSQDICLHLWPNWMRIMSCPVPNFLFSTQKEKNWSETGKELGMTIGAEIFIEGGYFYIIF